MLERGRDRSTSCRPSDGPLGRRSRSLFGGKAARRRGLCSRSVWAAFLCTLGVVATVGLTASSAALATNYGDVWVDNVGQPAGPGHEMDPHLACSNINLWGADLAGSSGTFTIDGYPPSGSQEQVYADAWSYNQRQGGDQVVAVINVGKLIRTAVANGDAPINGQGFHFKLQYSLDPQKHKTFWVNCSTPGLTTSATSAIVGGSIRDSATLSGGSAETGTITWKLYGPTDSSCSASPLETYTNSAVNGDGTYYSPSYVANSAGTYRWVASYSGDGSNLSTAGSCNDPGEQSTVTKASPSLSTSAIGAVVGGSIQDTATLSGGHQPTGTITWKLYGPTDPNCSAGPIQTYTDSTINGDGTYDSPTYVANSVGTYRWVASYSGDGANLSTAGSCNDPGEDSLVNPAVPTLSTDAFNGTAGGSIHDAATLSGGYSPTGTITWNLYDASADPSCLTPLNGGPITVPVTGDGVYDSPAVSIANAGTYQWVATYSGDANNTSLAGSCNDTTEQSTVSTQPVPKIALTKLEQVSSTAPGGYVAGPVYGHVGDTVNYQMTVTNTGNTVLQIAFSDLGCDSHTLSAVKVLTGTYDQAHQMLSSGGALRYTCSHVLTSNDQPPSGYTNTASVTGTPPTGAALTKQASVQAFAMVPGIKVVKFERDASTGGAFVASPSTITVSAGDKIDYRIEVTNTGNEPLALSAQDPHCDAGTLRGPTSVSGKLSGHTLSPGGVAQYTCSHVAAAADLPQYTNTVTVTGRPPSGPPVHGGSTVVAYITKAAIQVVKLERDAAAGGPFTRGPITITEKAGAYVVHTIDYKVVVTNKGNVSLTLRLDDPRCDAGTVSGPIAVSGKLNGDVLEPGGVAQYLCTHALVKSDPSPFTNTATVTGTPPVGAPVRGSSSVTVKKQTVAAKKLCRTPNGRVIHYTGHKKPAACRFHPKKPKHPGGFTG
jgi:hypothetical protein